MNTPRNPSRHRAPALCAIAGATLALALSSAPADAQNIFNTVKTKLAEGRQVVGGTVSSADVDIYCAMANAGFDFLWIEMQHSALTYAQVATMIHACPGPAIPFVRAPIEGSE